MRRTRLYMSVPPFLKHHICSQIIRVRLVLLVALVLISINILGQQRCGTSVYTDLRRGKLPGESEQQFENWLKENQVTQKREKTNGREQPLTYKVQVIVHVIHNGENIGQGVNIPA